MAVQKRLPAHPLDARIPPILRGCLQLGLDLVSDSFSSWPLHVFFLFLMYFPSIRFLPSRQNVAALFNCTEVDRASDSMMALLKVIHFSWLGPELCCLVTGAQLMTFICFRFAVVFFGSPGISNCHATRFIY